MASKSIPKGSAALHRTRDADQHLSEVSIDAPLTGLVRVGQRGARDVTGSPDGKVCREQNEGQFQYREGSREKLTAQSPSIETDRDMPEDQFALVHGLLSSPAKPGFRVPSAEKSVKSKTRLMPLNSHDI